MNLRELLRSVLAPSAGKHELAVALVRVRPARTFRDSRHDRAVWER
jgi:hypothetical protein